MVYGLTNKLLHSAIMTQPILQKTEAESSSASGNQHHKDNFMSGEHWLKTGNFFAGPAQHELLNHLMLTDLPNQLSKMRPDIKFCSNLPAVHQQIRELISAALSPDSSEQLLDPRVERRLNNLKKDCQLNLASDYAMTKEDTYQLSELNASLDELSLIINKRKLEQSQIPGTEIISAAQCLAKLPDVESLTGTLQSAHHSPEFANSTVDLLQCADQLLNFLKERPKEQALINELAGGQLVKVLQTAANKLTQLANHCSAPGIKADMTALADTIQSLPPLKDVHKVINSMDLNNPPVAPGLFKTKNFQYGSKNGDVIGSLYFQDKVNSQRLRLCHRDNPLIDIMSKVSRQKTYYPPPEMHIARDWTHSLSPSKIKAFTKAHNIPSKPVVGNKIFEYFDMNYFKTNFQTMHYSRGVVDLVQGITQKDINLIYQGIDAKLDSDQLRAYIDILVEKGHLLPALKQ